ncbi:hypothetical protein B0H10DRAFT_1981577 [Mycena sp. CBHHK59/15]|nr:hypothetical protein B0H10DRAFT_1981577 [Mycena sp. CBHHK59/15]
MSSESHVEPRASPRLPNELADRVIDDLHSEPRVLANCTLVCRAWVPAAQRNLFSKLTIHEHNCAEIVQHLTSATTNIAGYVKRLRAFLWGDLRVNLDRRMAIPAPVLNAFIPQISNFKNVTMLELDGCRLFHEEIWDKTWTDHLASVFPSLRQLDVGHIAFENVADLVDLVSSFSSLTHLTASELDFTDASHEFSNEPQEPGPFLSWLASGHQAMSTLILDLDAEAGDVNAGVELIGAAGHNLKVLHLNFSDQWQLWEGLEFSVHDTLRLLDLRSVADFGDSLVDILETVKSPLEHLILGGMHELEEGLWTSLIDLLMSPSFASLTKVDFYAGGGDHGEELKNKVSDQFPEFFERRIAAFGD